jgi:5-keto 4-deoxyuronate isomerase
MVNYEVRYSTHPEDVKLYDTSRLRDTFLIERLMVEGDVNMVYTLDDRLIVGGAVPTTQALHLEAIDPLKAPNFLHRRELGIINVGGQGVVIVGDQEYALNHKEALYVGSTDVEVYFKSIDAKSPAHFYFNSAPAHKSFPNKKVTLNDAIVIEAGSPTDSNARRINKLIVRELLDTCQLQMGMTELMEGSVWNTMPPHTHARRMEAYFYFEVPSEHAVCHFMGPTDETRHIWMHNEQAVISPAWSIHSACATNNYTFIWGMAGENMDYSDMDSCLASDLV